MSKSRRAFEQWRRIAPRVWAYFRTSSRDQYIAITHAEDRPYAALRAYRAILASLT